MAWKAITHVGSLISRSYQSNPQLTNGMSGLITFSVGDVFSQKLVDPARDVNYIRAAKTGMLGIFMNGAVLHHWYNILDLSFGKSMLSRKGIFLKVLADQLVYSPFSIVVFFGFASCLSPSHTVHNEVAAHSSTSDFGSTSARFLAKMENSFLPVLIADCCMWPFVNLINFSHVPKNYRPSFVGLAQLVWQTYVSYIGHSLSSPK